MIRAYFIFFLLTSNAYATPISLRIDEEDCANGWLSMDVAVIVDGEYFSFSPSCNFSFNETFSTSTGIECRIESSMCFNHPRRSSIEVNCDGGSDEEGFWCS